MAFLKSFVVGLVGFGGLLFCLALALGLGRCCGCVGKCGAPEGTAAAAAASPSDQSSCVSSGFASCLLPLLVEWGRAAR